MVLGSQSYLLTGEMNIFIKASLRGRALGFGDSVCYLMNSPPFLSKHSTVQNGHWPDHRSQTGSDSASGRRLAISGGPSGCLNWGEGERGAGDRGQASQQRVCCRTLLKLGSPDLGTLFSSHLGTGAWAVSLCESCYGSHCGCQAAWPCQLPVHPSGLGSIHGQQKRRQACSPPLLCR